MAIDTKKTIEHLKTLDCPIPELQVVQERGPKTHDLTAKTWGHNYTITQIINHGERLRLSVWYAGLIRSGDYLILAHENGQTTRYQVEKIEYCRDPADMGFVDAVFAPREAPAE